MFACMKLLKSLNVYHSFPSIHNKSAAESKTIKYYIHYFHIAYTTPWVPPSPKINCLTIAFLCITVVPIESKNNGYAKFWEVDEGIVFAM